MLRTSDSTSLHIDAHNDAVLDATQDSKQTKIGRSQDVGAEEADAEKDVSACLCRCNVRMHLFRPAAAPVSGRHAKAAVTSKRSKQQCCCIDVSSSITADQMVEMWNLHVVEVWTALIDKLSVLFV